MIDPEKLFEDFKNALLKSGIRAKVEDRKPIRNFGWTGKKGIEE